MKDALKYAAHVLKEDGLDLTIIASGGIVDYLRLKSNHPVHDLTFFNYDIAKDHIAKLEAALSHAERMSESETLCCSQGML